MNGEMVHSFVKDNTAASQTTTSGTTVQRLEKGAEVWVQQDADYGRGYYYDGTSYAWNHFS